MTKSTSWKADPNDPVYDEMRLRILSSASEIILETGISRLRLDGVAKRAGVSRSSLYRYFDSKEQVVYELLVYEFNKLAERMTRETQSINDPVERLLEAVVLSVEAYRQDPNIRKLVGPGNEYSIGVISFALERITGRITPFIREFGFFANETLSVREKKNDYLARWLMNIIFSLGVFGCGGLSTKEEKAMLKAMLVPILSS